MKAVRSDLKDIIKKAEDDIKQIQKHDNVSRTIVMFDLVGSTVLKLKIGHDKAMEKIIEHNEICRKFIDAYKGHILKELGDGILAHFDNAEKACLCAINFREAINLSGTQTKVSIASGMVQPVTIVGKNDFIGHAIDVCAKIEKFAFPDQILLDHTTFGCIQSFLENYDDLEISNTMNAVMKGSKGKQELFEISTKQKTLKNHLNISFHVNEEGRLPLDDKVSFILNAKHEIIELGIRLREFAHYFKGRNPEEFEDHVLTLLKNGVVLKCYALDSEWALQHLPIVENEQNYYKGIPETLEELGKFRDKVNKQGLKGRVEIYTYQHQPFFHAQCTDGNYPEGQMTVSNYLFGIERSSSPVIQFSKYSHPTMFQRYWESIQKTIESSKVWNS